MSTKTYTRISEDEFDAFMADTASAERVEMAGVSETVYEMPLPSDDLSIRVFSTIAGGAGRDRGADAIRTVVWSRRAGGPVGGERKTLRIGTWRKNLRRKIEELYANWRDYDHGDCPECDSGVLVERRSGSNADWSPFLACSAWNGGRGCEHTESL